MKGYAKYLAVPIGALVLLALRLLLGAARGPLPAVLVEVGGASVSAGAPGAPLARLLAEATVASGVARPARAGEEPRARIRYLGGPGGAAPGLPAPGETLVLGHEALLGAAAAPSPFPPGSPRPTWKAAYLPRLEEAPRAAPGAVARWSAREGRTWDFRGGGLLLERLADGEVLVLRRGVELAPDYLRVLPGPGVDAPSSLLGGRFLVCEPPPAGNAVPALRIVLSGRLRTLPTGESLLRAAGLPPEFLLVWSEAASGTWSFAIELLEGESPRKELLPPLLPGLAARTALDEPLDRYARFRRVLVPIWRVLLAEAL